MGRSHALEILFLPKIVHRQNHIIFSNKMCPLSVQNVNIYYEQKFVFVKVFKYDTNISDIFQKKKASSALKLA